MARARLLCIAGWVHAIKFWSGDRERGRYPCLWRGLGSQGVEQFGRSAALVSLLDHQLSFLDHMHEFDTDQRVLSRHKRLESEHRTCDPFYCSVVLLHDIVSIFDLADRDRCPKLLVVALDGALIGVTAINGDGLRHSVAADRHLEKP